jgi:hypothetical protein
MLDPSGTVNKRLVLIGKGLTFDSGGYNLKVRHAGSLPRSHHGHHHTPIRL